MVFLSIHIVENVIINFTWSQKRDKPNGNDKINHKIKLIGLIYTVSGKLPLYTSFPVVKGMTDQVW